MSATAAWILIALAVTAAAVIGFYLGRHTAPGKHQVDSLQQELEQSRQTLAEYRQSVNRHFEKTAGLFTNMAGSYRDLYDHLRDSYSSLTDTPGRPLLPERAGALLEGGRSPAPESRRSANTDRPATEGRQPGEPGAGKIPDEGPESESEDMLGDAPHIPQGVDLEVAPQHTVRARRDEDQSAGSDHRKDPSRSDAKAAPGANTTTDGETGQTPAPDTVSEAKEKPGRERA